MKSSSFGKCLKAFSRFDLMTLLFASSNTHKIQEMRELCEPDLDILSAGEAGFLEPVEESGHTFVENARVKARAIWQRSYGLDTFADDSGLSCKALRGEPGIYSARYAGTGNSQDNIDLLLANMEGKKDRFATFICVICLAKGDSEYYFEGRVDGEISFTIQGQDGFGYDPVFIPGGHDRSFAQMDAREKNLISHRAIAVRKLKAFLTA